MIFEPGERGERGGGCRRLFLFSLLGSMQTFGFDKCGKEILVDLIFIEVSASC